MTSLLHLAILLKPIKSTLMQSYLLFSPPSNAFLHLPCASAHQTPPQANTGRPSPLLGGFALQQLSLPWRQQGASASGTRAWGKATVQRWKQRDLPQQAADHLQARSAPSHPTHSSLGFTQVVHNGRGLAPWDGVSCWLQEPALTSTATATCSSRAHPESYAQLLPRDLNTHRSP